MSVFRVDGKENRKVIPGYGGVYEVGDLGRVYRGGFELNLIDGRYVNLSWKGDVRRLDVAYLVARAFLSNLEGRPYVVHKDGDVRNNRVDNLEWSEVRRRADWKRRNVGKAVVQYDLEGVLVGRYESLKDAEEKTGVARYLIRNCAEGKAKRAHNWIFRYV